MGMMLGAVLQNPALCGIPIESEAMIATNTYCLAIFTACLHTLISHFIRYSIQRKMLSFREEHKGGF